jgi:hypothetical protein
MPAFTKRILADGSTVRYQAVIRSRGQASSPRLPTARRVRCRDTRARQGPVGPTHRGRKRRPRAWNRTCGVRADLRGPARERIQRREAGFRPLPNQLSPAPAPSRGLSAAPALPKARPGSIREMRARASPPRVARSRPDPTHQHKGSRATLQLVERTGCVLSGGASAASEEPTPISESTARAFGGPVSSSPSAGRTPLFSASHASPTSGARTREPWLPERPRLAEPGWGQPAGVLGEPT